MKKEENVKISQAVENLTLLMVRALLLDTW